MSKHVGSKVDHVENHPIQRNTFDKTYDVYDSDNEEVESIDSDDHYSNFDLNESDDNEFNTMDDKISSKADEPNGTSSLLTSSPSLYELLEQNKISFVVHMDEKSINDWVNNVMEYYQYKTNDASSRVRSFRKYIRSDNLMLAEEKKL